jgi:hypothetical protein
VSASQQHHLPLPIPLPTHSLQVDVPQVSSSAAFTVLLRQHLLQSGACCMKLLRRIVRPRRIPSAATVSGVHRAAIWAGPHCSASPAASSQAMLTSRQEVQLARQLTDVAVANRNLIIVRCASAHLATALRVSFAFQCRASRVRVAHRASVSHSSVAFQRRVSASRSSVAFQRRVSASRFSVAFSASRFQRRVLCIAHRESRIARRASRIANGASFIAHRVSRIAHRTLRIAHRASRIVHRASYVSLAHRASASHIAN